MGYTRLYSQAQNVIVGLIGQRVLSFRKRHFGRFAKIRYLFTPPGVFETQKQYRIQVPPSSSVGMRCPPGSSIL